MPLCLGALIAAALALSGAGGGQAAPARLAQVAPVSACTSPFDLTNGSFETPDVGAFAITDQSRVTGWHTTESDGKIEVWQSGYLGVPAAAGEQFAELSANSPASSTRIARPRPAPSSPTRSHTAAAAARTRWRSGSGPLGRAAELHPQRSPPPRPPGTTCSGTTPSPPGRRVTRFGFAAVHNASGDPTIGNFLDNVILTQAQCTLTVRKRLAPAADPGRFDLLADGRALARAVADGGAAGPVALPQSEVTVSERAALGTDGSAYASAIRCTDADSGEMLAQAAGRETTLRLDRPRNVDCVAANVHGPAVVLRKELELPGDDGRFDLSVNGDTVAPAAGDGAVAGPTLAPGGTVSVAEAPAAGTDGGDYASGIQCRNRAGRGDVIAHARGRRVNFSVAPRSLVVCLLLNVAQDTPPEPTPIPAPVVPDATVTGEQRRPERARERARGPCARRRTRSFPRPGEEPRAAHRHQRARHPRRTPGRTARAPGPPNRTEHGRDAAAGRAPARHLRHRTSDRCVRALETCSRPVGHADGDGTQQRGAARARPPGRRRRPGGTRPAARQQPRPRTRARRGAARAPMSARARPRRLRYRAPESLTDLHGEPGRLARAVRSGIGRATKLCGMDRPAPASFRP